MLALHKLATLTATGAVLALGVAAPAHATESDTTQNTLSHPVQDCGEDGVFWKRGMGTLTNGIMDFGFCEQDGLITRVNASYTKTAGADSHLKFGWTLVNRWGVPQVTEWGDAFRQPANTTRFHSWTSLHIPLTEPFVCLQGMLQDQNTGKVFYTERACA